MSRTHIRFDPRQYERLRRQAFDERQSIAELVRRYVEEGLLRDAGGRTEEARVDILSWAGALGRGGPPDLGRRHDDHLSEDGTT